MKGVFRQSARRTCVDRSVLVMSIELSAPEANVQRPPGSFATIFRSNNDVPSARAPRRVAVSDTRWISNDKRASLPVLRRGSQHSNRDADLWGIVLTAVSRTVFRGSFPVPRAWWRVGADSVLARARQASRRQSAIWDERSGCATRSTIQSDRAEGGCLIAMLADCSSRCHS